MAILTLKVVNLTYYNLKGGQFKVILTLNVVIFDLKVIKNGFGISDLISDFGISDFKIISDFGFGISDLPKYFGFYAILSRNELRGSKRIIKLETNYEGRNELRNYVSIREIISYLLNIIYTHYKL